MVAVPLLRAWHHHKATGVLVGERESGVDFERDDRRDGQRFSDVHTRPQPEYRINLTIAVVDPQALWTAALAKLLAAPGMTVDDSVDVIGPCEDPSISECIATLATPAALPGCIMDDVWIDSLSGAPHRIDATDGALDYKLGSGERGRWTSRRGASAPARAMPPPVQDVAQPN